MRLKQVFNQQIVSFREACYFLFGYKVDAAAKATAAGAGAAPTTFVLTPQVCLLYAPTPLPLVLLLHHACLASMPQLYYSLAARTLEYQTI